MTPPERPDMTSTDQPAACEGALNLAGMHYPCDRPTDATGKHTGWAHTNKDASAVWCAVGPSSAVSS